MLYIGKDEERDEAEVQTSEVNEGWEPEEDFYCVISVAGIIKSAEVGRDALYFNNGVDERVDLDDGTWFFKPNYTLRVFENITFVSFIKKLWTIHIQ